MLAKSLRKDIRHPRFSLYPPLAMGFIQPEWLVIYHLFRVEKEAASAPESSPMSISATPIKITIRGRK
jgi:hypothetical protein